MLFKNSHYVYELYKERNFTKAAKNLYITQPSLSAAIKKLEEEIGMPIFDRSTNPISLTECGKAYMECVEEMLSIEHRFMESISNLSELKVGKIRIGGSQYILAFIYPEIIRRYKEKYPGVDVSLVEGNISILEQQLFNGTVDLIFTSNRLPSNIYAKELVFSEKLLLAVPQSDPINNELEDCRISLESIKDNSFINDGIPAVPFESFNNKDFVLLSSNNMSRRVAEEIFDSTGISPNIVLQVDHQLTAYMAASSGIGTAFISDTMIKNMNGNENCFYYKIPSSLAYMDMFCCYKHTAHITPAMRQFIETAKNTFMANENGVTE